MKRILPIFPGTVVCALVLLLFAAQQSSASTLTVSSIGNGIFSLQGTGMDDIASLDIVLQYDAATLANPRVEKGNLIAGAMMATNPNTPGVLRIAIIRTMPFSGSGDILSLTFDRKSSGPGTIIGLTVRAADINGKPMQASGQITNMAFSSVAGGGSSSQTTASQSPTTAATSQTPKTTIPPVVISGSVKLEEETKPKPEATGEADQELKIPVEEPAQPEDKHAEGKSSEEPAPPAKRVLNIHTQASVLDRFSKYKYKGARPPKALMALFDQEPMIGFSQEPRIVITKDLASVIVTLISLSTDTSVPELTLKGARLISLTKDAVNTNTWIAELRPDKGTCKSSISVNRQDLIMEFPLTVAPEADVDIDKSGKVTKRDFTLYLKGPKGKNIKKYDMNGDGVIDYRDDYIFTANYIVALSPGKRVTKNDKMNTPRPAP